MPITVTLPSVLAAHTGGARTVDVDGRTVGRALDDLVSRYPQLASRLRDTSGAPYPFVTIYLNDEDVRVAGGFEAAVRDGDEVTIVPAVAGG